MILLFSLAPAGENNVITGMGKASVDGIGAYLGKQ
jgi:hypothetical protein